MEEGGGGDDDWRARAEKRVPMAGYSMQEREAERQKKKRVHTRKDTIDARDVRVARAKRRAVGDEREREKG